MLAVKPKPIADHLPPPVQTAVPLFPLWHVLLVESNRERRAADWLSLNTDTVAYWPNFPRQYRSRGRLTHHRLCSVMPGLLFIPLEFMANGRRDEILDFIHCRGFLMSSGAPAVLSKEQIEVIREIEAKLNMPVKSDGTVRDALGRQVKVGQPVRLVNELYAAFLGQGVVADVVNDTRIGVSLGQLFGAPRTVYVPASELEVL